MVKEWAKKHFLKMKEISDPNQTAMSMIKGVMESGLTPEVKITRIQAIIEALEETK